MNPNQTFIDYSYNYAIYREQMDDELFYRAKRNSASVTDLVNALFHDYSRILVVRVDLKYRTDVGTNIPVGLIQQHREVLLTDRRGYPVFEDLVGYAWGLEYGEAGEGWHIHLLAFYDGANRHDDVGLGLAIGGLWHEITGGWGYCYVSNFDKEKFAAKGELGIGMIHRCDGQLRVNLIERVAAYITKKSAIAHRALSERTQTGRFRTFGRSSLPEPPDHYIPRRGRPLVITEIRW